MADPTSMKHSVSSFSVSIFSVTDITQNAEDLLKKFAKKVEDFENKVSAFRYLYCKAKTKAASRKYKLNYHCRDLRRQNWMHFAHRP